MEKQTPKEKQEPRQLEEGKARWKVHGSRAKARAPEAKMGMLSFILKHFLPAGTQMDEQEIIHKPGRHCDPRGNQDSPRDPPEPRCPSAWTVLLPTLSTSTSPF